MGPVSDKEREFQLKLEREGKARERMTIQALITAKQVRVSTTKQTSVTTLNELSEVMYQQTNSTLPDALKGALQGKGADAAGKYLKQLTKPSLKTPMKRG
ncbi:hypothetical protein CKN86_13175 [Carnobacterium divergens]|nr:hypothetical protein [Carnobacterium divergens]MCO6017201.1 hypothetical protein [Carnobacterium divergens]TFI61350.1 hypothetical protein CKN62_13315 [Carnobacterium divergens]TFI88371.1 hypothetical protein CKN84_13205 [Carnobacterium divergens]TFJ02940.1 hypothetical protein CKN86_13175 [Carnobacterium divergens]TFJ04489.1 hypothetical protein CKN65_13425 [Carnobacterium divergens]